MKIESICSMNSFFAIFIIIFSSLPILSWEEIKYGGKDGLSFKETDRKGVTVISREDNSGLLKLAKKKKKGSELHLDFESRKPSDLKDKANHYEIIKSSYSVNPDGSAEGKRFASFTARESYIAISTRNNRLLGSKRITEPFYISFYIIPAELARNASVFYKNYPTGGKVYGLECNVESGKLEVHFQNLYFFENNTRSFTLKSPDKLKAREWTHVLISIDPMEGSASLYEDGKEKDSFQSVLSTEDPTLLFLGFHKNDTTPFYIGKNFYGKMDNFLISEGKPDLENISATYNKIQYDEMSETAEQVRGEVSSKVISTKYSASKPVSLFFDSELPEGTHLDLYYRFSDKKFPENDNTISWKTVQLPLGTKASYRYEFPEKIDNKEFRFQYFQWKASLRSNYKGILSPALKQITLRYEEMRPPREPVNFKITSLDQKDLKVCFEWNSNHEMEVQNGGGYIIHYGVDPDRMVGTILFKKNPDGTNSKLNGKNEKVKEEKKSNGEDEKSIEENLSNEANKKTTKKNEYLSLGECVDNDLIIHNSFISKNKNLLFMKRGIAYYFKLSAYNKYFPIDSYYENNVSGKDQKSPLSKPVQFTFGGKDGSE